MIAQTDIAIFLFVLLVGVAAFFFGVLYFLFSVFMGIARVFGRMLGFGVSSRRMPVAVRVRGGPIRCAQARCGHFEGRPGARYCSQCGGRLPVHESFQVDQHTT